MTVAGIATVAVANHDEGQTDLHGYTLRDLELEARPEDWQDIRISPEALETFAMCLRESRQIEAGIRPERWTSTATCMHCGEDWVPEFLAGWRLAGCRWCAPRRAGVSIPKTA